MLDYGSGQNESFLQRSFYFLERFTPFLLFNLIWFLLFAPLVVAFLYFMNYLATGSGGGALLAGLGLVAATFIAFPGTAGLYYVTNLMAHGKDGSVGLFFEGFKTYYWVSLRWGWVNLVVAFLVSLNYWFYGNLAWKYAYWMQAAFIGVGTFWSILQVYTFPLLIEQHDAFLKIALRNALVIFVRFPFKSILLAVALAALVVVSTLVFPPLWFFISAALVGYFANKALISFLAQIRATEAQRKEQETAAASDDQG